MCKFVGKTSGRKNHPLWVKLQQESRCVEAKNRDFHCFQSWLPSIRWFDLCRPLTLKHHGPKHILAARHWHVFREDYIICIYIRIYNIYIYGGFLKWWYPITMGFPTRNDHFGVFWGYHHLRKHPYTGPGTLWWPCLVLGGLNVSLKKNNWWFQPIWKKCSSNSIISPIFGVENKACLKPSARNYPTGFMYYYVYFPSFTMTYHKNQLQLSVNIYTIHESYCWWKKSETTTCAI